MIVAVVSAPDAAGVRAAMTALAIGASTPAWRGQQLAVEVRFDLMTTPDVEVCRHAPMPVVATCRRPRDGGRFRGGEHARLALLRAAGEAGATWIDVEDDVLDAFGETSGARLVVSHHDFEGLPIDLPALVQRMKVPGADVIKLAVRVRSLIDLVSLAAATREAPGRVIAVGLGPAGIATRWLFDRLGSPWVYLRAAAAHASDGLPADLPAIAEFTGVVRGGPALPPAAAAFGVIGDRAHESLGPWMFNRVFRAAGIPAVYAPFTTRGLTGLREAAHAFGLRGVSVTTPFKEDALAFADEVHPRARAVGAANTLVLDAGRWRAFNTDVDGIAVPLRAALKHAGRDPLRLVAVVVGAGGAGRAAVHALTTLGCRVVLAGRNAARTATVAATLGVPSVHVDELAPHGADLVVNATPAGSLRDPEGSAVDLAWLRPDGWVFETNYVPRETPLVRAARAAGFSVICGDAMFLAQAVAQFHLFWATAADPTALFTEALTWAYGRPASS